MQHTDDRLGVKSDAEAECNGSKVAYVLLQVLTRLGYTLLLEKCSLIP